MPLPTDALSILNVGKQLRYPNNLATDLLLKDYSFGPIAIGDGVAGVDVKVWEFSYIGNDVVCKPIDESLPSTVLFTKPGITELSGTFSQGGRAAVAYMAGGSAWIWWYHSTFSAYDHYELIGCSSPKLRLDEPHLIATSIDKNDMILVYIKSNNLYYRQQRSKFETEILLTDAVVGVGYRISAMGMDNSNRLHIEIQLKADS